MDEAKAQGCRRSSRAGARVVRSRKDHPLRPVPGVPSSRKTLLTSGCAPAPKVATAHASLGLFTVAFKTLHLRPQTTLAPLDFPSPSSASARPLSPCLCTRHLVYSECPPPASLARTKPKYPTDPTQTPPFPRYYPNRLLPGWLSSHRPQLFGTLCPLGGSFCTSLRCTDTYSTKTRLREGKQTWQVYTTECRPATKGKNCSHPRRRGSWRQHLSNRIQTRSALCE